MRKLILLTILTMTLIGCKMRYGNIPRVTTWHKGNSEKTTRESKVRIYRVERKSSDLSRVWNDKILIDPLPDSISIPVVQTMPVDFPGAEPFLMHEPDSPSDRSIDTTESISDEQLYRSQKNAYKGFFFGGMIGLNIMFLMLENPVGLVLFGAFTSFFLLAMVISEYGRALDRNNRLGEYGDLRKRMSSLVLFGIAMLILGILLIAIGIFEFEEIVFLIGMLILIFGLSSLVIGIIEINKFFSGNPEFQYPKSPPVPTDGGMTMRDVSVFLLLILLIIFLALILAAF